MKLFLTILGAVIVGNVVSQAIFLAWGEQGMSRFFKRVFQVLLVLVALAAVFGLAGAAIYALDPETRTVLDREVVAPVRAYTRGWFD